MLCARILHTSQQLTLYLPILFKGPGIRVVPIVHYTDGREALVCQITCNLNLHNIQKTKQELIFVTVKGRRSAVLLKSTEHFKILQFEVYGP